MEVILASHAHQVPQVGFPHIDPVTKAIKVNRIPEGAKLFEIKIKFFKKTETGVGAVHIYVAANVQSQLMYTLAS